MQDDGMSNIKMEPLSSDEEDPVVDEVDVYLSKQLVDNLVLLQYPVRPSHITYDTVQHLNTRYKPKQLKLEVEHHLDTHSPNYARSKGEQIALNVDGRDPGEKSMFNSDLMDKQVLASHSAGVSSDRYVLGVLRDKELHITPLKGILQMKPNFRYLDQADIKHPKEGADDGGHDSQDDDDEAKPVMMKFARQETEDAKARRMASYDYLKKQDDAEKWVKLNYHGIDSRLSESERLLLFAQHGKDVSEFYMSQDDYLKMLLPQEEELAEKKPAMPNNVLSMTDLKKMALGDQVRALLISAKVIRYSQLMSLLPKGTDGTSVLRYVQQVAMLVQGCWVVKSEVLYPKDSFSAVSGVPAETLSKGRDYIMWRFLNNRFLVRKDIASVIKLPAEDVKDIMEQMGRFKVHKGWEFLMDFDHEFVNRHIEVAQRQQMLWDRKFQQLSETLNVTKGDIKQATNAASAANLISPKRRRTTSQSRTKSGGELSMSDLSDGDVEIQKGRHGNSSGSERRRNSSGNRKISISDVPMNIKTENGMDSDTAMPLNENGNKDVDPNLLKSELKKFAVDRLHSRFALSMSDFKRLFLLKLAECPPGHVLGTGVSDTQLMSTIMDIGAKKISFGPNSEPIFVLDKVGDGRDDIRKVLINMLEEKPQVRIGTFKKRLEELRVEASSDNDLRRLLKDYCTPKGAVWSLKGTMNPEDS